MLRNFSYFYGEGEKPGKRARDQLQTQLCFHVIKVLIDGELYAVYSNVTIKQWERKHHVQLSQHEWVTIYSFLTPQVQKVPKIQYK